MKKILYFTLFFSLLSQVSCKKDEYELGTPPTSADAAFSFVTSPTSDNVLTFASKSGVVAVWDFGNGSTATGNVATASYPAKGDYFVTLTIYAKGGSASNTQVVTIVNDDFSLLDDPVYTNLTGGKDSINGKTWVLDSATAAHFGVGPNPTGAAGDYPEYYAAGANEKATAGMYDDRYTFYIDQFQFDMVTNGDVYINEKQQSAFPGSTPSSVGDYTAPFPDQLNESWVLNFGDDTTLKVSRNSFLGYNTGVSEYKVIRLKENELFLSYLDVNDGTIRWYIRLIPEGYNPGGPPPVPTYSLPLDFETIEPAVEVFGGSTVSYKDNGDPRGINTSARVLETVHGSEKWAGFYINLDSKLDFSTNTNISFKIWAPTSGTVRVKLENSDNTQEFIELDASVGVAFRWIPISIDFSGTAAGKYDRLVLFPGWDVANAGTFEIDDIEQN